VARAVLRGVGAAVYGASKGAQFLREVASEVGVDANRSSGTTQRLTSGLAGVWPVLPLQIGVLHADAWCAMLVASHGVMDTNWHELSDDEATTGRDGSVLDGVLHSSGAAMTLRTRLHAGIDAAQQDWASLAQRVDGRGFSHLFPLRQDCASLTLPAEIASDDARLARLLVEAACLLSRHPARTDLGDRLAGRAANWNDNSAGQASLNSICTAMQAELEQRHASWSSVREIAAQFLSQWASTSATITQSQRLEVCELCARLLRSDAFATLRLGAVRLGQLDDAGGLDALSDAAHALKLIARVSPGSAAPMTDQLPFLLAELESGFGHPLSLGRVAAGLTLTAATMDASELREFRDDIRDELRFSNALMGKDQDRYLIEQVFVMLAEQAEGFASVVSSDAAATPAQLSLQVVRDAATDASPLADDEVQDDHQPHGFLQLTSQVDEAGTPGEGAGRTLNPWQALATSLAENEPAAGNALRLTGAKKSRAKATRAKKRAPSKQGTKRATKAVARVSAKPRKRAA
jgi:hypothetical protein